MKLIIPISSGKKFALISGDNNKIHLSNKYASNSIYGRKICHGCNFLIKFLKLKEISKYTSKKKYSIYINFIDAIDYDIGIDIIKKKNVFKIYQNKVIKSEIVFKKIIEKPIVKIKKINYQQKNKYNNNLAEILEVLSKYVGTIYPGEHSIIKSININYKYKSTNNQKHTVGNIPII